MARALIISGLPLKRHRGDENCIIEVDTNFNFTWFTCLNPLGRHIDKVLVNSPQATLVASKNLKLLIILCKSSTCIYTAHFLDNLHSECGLDSQLEAIQTL